RSRQPILRRGARNLDRGRPCRLASAHLTPPDTVDTRDLWILMPSDLVRVARVRAVWDFIVDITTIRPKSNPGTGAPRTPSQKSGLNGGARTCGRGLRLADRSLTPRSRPKDPAKHALDLVLRLPHRGGASPRHVSVGPHEYGAIPLDTVGLLP